MQRPTVAENLAELHDELTAYPGDQAQPPPARADVVVPLRYCGEDRELSFLSITAMVGMPMDVTVSELAIESSLARSRSGRARLRGHPRAAAGPGAPARPVGPQRAGHLVSGPVLGWRARGSTA